MDVFHGLSKSVAVRSVAPLAQEGQRQYRVSAEVPYAIPSAVSAIPSATPNLTMSSAFEAHPVESFDPTTVRAQKAQDPAKHGALHPDGRTVQMHNLAAEDRAEWRPGQDRVVIRG